VEFGVEFVKMLGALVVVLLFLVAALFGVKKAGAWARKPERNDWIQVVAQHSIGIKHHLVLVKIQENLLLVGVSPQGMHLLTPSHPGASPWVATDAQTLHQSEKS
jgi:flagellar biosynthetic protein FliO